MDNTTNGTNPQLAAQAEEESSINIKELFFICLGNWYWFVISIVICMTLAVFKILCTPPVYSRSAQVLIKVDSNGRNKGMSNVGGMDFDLFQQKANINNELATFRSPDLMADVVKRLDLEMTYTEPGTFHERTLYGTTQPVKVSITTMSEPDKGRSFRLLIKPDSTFVISKIVYGLDDLSVADINGKINSTVSTPIGQLTITATDAYPDEEMIVDVERSPLLTSVTKYEGELTVSQDDEKSSVVVLTVDDVSTQRAVDIINTLIFVYNQRWVDDKNQISVSTSNFIDERLAVIEHELGNVDTDISSYKSTNLLPDVGAASQMYMKQASDANAQILQLNNKLYMAKYVRSYLADSDRFQLLPVNSGFESSSLATQISNYNQQVLERNSLAANSSVANPIVKDMDTAINDLKRSILFSIDNEIESLTAQIKTQQNYENQAVSQIASNPQQAKYLLTVERQQKVKESLYLYLLQKREENELSQAFTAYNTRVIVEPQGPRQPIEPKRRNIYLIAIVVGIAIPFGILYLRTVLNTKVRGRKDIEGMTVPFVGEIPEAEIPGVKKAGKNLFGKKRKKPKGIVVVKEGSRNVINEAFRVIRSNLEFMTGGQGEVIAVTSANPGSGKTFITFNLAASFALKDKRVLAIDLDLRKGSLSEYVDKPDLGISDYIAGRVNDIDKYIVHNAKGTKLDLLPMGTMPPNPTELLYSPRFHEVIEYLKTQYDVIFLDCPPAEIVADASIITKEANYTMFIIRAGLFERSMIRDIENFYATGKYNNLIIALNGTESSSRYGYRYSYRYGYRYGYGSGSYGGYTKD